MQAPLGYVLLLGVAFLLGERRRPIPWRTVIGGLALQWALALLLLRVPPARHAVGLLTTAADALQAATDQGAGFLFGYLAGPPLPFTELHPGAGFILAFKMLPLVLVISAIGAVLFQWGVLQRVVGLFAALLRQVLGIDGPLALAAAVHIVVGMVEAPLLIRPYLATMSRGEIFATMTCGMAGVAGTVMVIYGAVLAPVLPDALGLIIVASVISTPAALAVAALMVPFDSGATRAQLDTPPTAGTLDALLRGTADGVPVLVGIATSLIVATTLVALVNLALAALPGAPTLQSLLAAPLRPVIWLTGIEWDQTGPAALIMATKTVLNEFVAYLALAQLPPETLTPHTRLVMTFALCGFANLGSLGILVGGLSALMPTRRAEVAALGVRSLLSGTVTTLLSATVASCLDAT